MSITVPSSLDDEPTEITAVPVAWGKIVDAEHRHSHVLAVIVIHGLLQSTPRRIATIRRRDLEPRILKAEFIESRDSSASVSWDWAAIDAERFQPEQRHE